MALSRLLAFASSACAAVRCAVPAVAVRAKTAIHVFTSSCDFPQGIWHKLLRWLFDPVKSLARHVLYPLLFLDRNRAITGAVVRKGGGNSAPQPPRRPDDARLRSGAPLPAQVIGATPEHLTAEDIPGIDLSLEGLTDPRAHHQTTLRGDVPLEGQTDRLELCETVGDCHWRQRSYGIVRAVYRSRTCPRGNRTPSDVLYSKTRERPVEAARRVGGRS